MVYAYYLVHAMISVGDDYDSHDRAVRNFIMMYGLVANGSFTLVVWHRPDLSKHLRSRRAWRKYFSPVMSLHRFAGSHDHWVGVF